MPKLIWEVQNISREPCPFVMLGQTPKKGKKEPGAGLVIRFVRERGPEHTRITVTSNGNVWPGQVFAQEAELPTSEHFDIRDLDWVTPQKYRGCFLLRRMTWGDHQCVEPGIV